VLLVASDISQDDGPDYRLGSSPTQVGAGDQGTGIPVPLEGGLVWAALHQDAIVVQLPDRSGPLAGRRRRCCAAEPLLEVGGQSRRSPCRADKGSGQGVHGLDGTARARS
jgi:hypothetical protein